MAERKYLRSGWSLAVELVVLEGFLAIFSVIPEGAFSSDGCTGIVPDSLSAMGLEIQM